MANGVPGQAGQSAASLAKAESEKGQDCATSRGPIQKDFHALETAQMNYHATLICAMQQVRF